MSTSAPVRSGVMPAERRRIPAPRGARAGDRRPAWTLIVPSPRQVARFEPAGDPPGVMLDGQVHDPIADRPEVEAGRGRHGREEADRGEARDRVDLAQVELVVD